MPKIIKILGNVFVIGGVIAGSGGALIATANQSPLEFSTFHW